MLIARTSRCVGWRLAKVNFFFIGKNCKLFVNNFQFQLSLSATSVSWHGWFSGTPPALWNSTLRGLSFRSVLSFDVTAERNRLCEQIIKKFYLFCYLIFEYINGEIKMVIAVVGKFATKPESDNTFNQ